MSLFCRILLLGSLVMAGSAFGSMLAVASCAQSTPAEQGARAQVIVVGTVVETRQTFFGAAGGVIRFRPERVLKGTLTTVAQVYLGPSRGGNSVTSVDYTAVVRGEQHTLYLRAAGDGSYETDACSGSHPGGPTADEERTFGAGVLVTAASDEGTSPVIIAAVVLLGGLAAAFVLVRARRTRP